MHLFSLAFRTVLLVPIGIALVSMGFLIEPQFGRTTLHALGLAALTGALWNNRQLISELENAGDE